MNRTVQSEEACGKRKRSNSVDKVVSPLTSSYYSSARTGTRNACTRSPNNDSDRSSAQEMEKSLLMALASAKAVDKSSMECWLDAAEGHAINTSANASSMATYIDRSKHIHKVFHQHAMEKYLTKALKRARSGDKVSTKYWLDHADKSAPNAMPNAISTYYEQAIEIQKELTGALHQQESRSEMDLNLSLALKSAKAGDKGAMILHLHIAEQYAEDAKAVEICNERGNDIFTKLVDRREYDLMCKYLTKVKHNVALGSGYSVNYWLAEAEKHGRNANAFSTFHERACSLRKELFDNYSNNALHFASRGEEVYMNVYLDQIEKYSAKALMSTPENRNFMAERISFIKSTCASTQEKEKAIQTRIPKGRLASQ